VPPEFQARLDLEHDRIRIADRRTALLEKVLAAGAAQDQREFEDRQTIYAAWRDRFKFLRFITFVCIGGVAVVIAVLLWRCCGEPKGRRRRLLRRSSTFSLLWAAQGSQRCSKRHSVI